MSAQQRLEFSVEQTRRAYWRNNAALQRQITEDEFARRGYDAELVRTLKARLFGDQLPQTQRRAG